MERHGAWKPLVALAAIAVTWWPYGQVHHEATALPRVRLVPVSQFGGSSNAVVADGNLAFLGVGTRIISLDISSPVDSGAIRAVGESAALGGVVRDAAIWSRHLFVAADRAGLAALDIDDPTRPIVLDTVPLPGRAQAVTLSGDYAFVAAGRDGVFVVDISDPSRLHSVSAIAAAGADVAGIAIDGSYCYLADRNGDGGGLRVVDISDVTRPVEVAAVGQSFSGMAVALFGQYAVVVGEGLHVIDVSRPLAPRQVGELSGVGGYDVAVRSRFAYVATGHDEPSLVVVNWQGGTQLKVLGEVPDRGFGQAVSLAGDWALVARGDRGGLAAVNVSDPQMPTVGSCYCHAGAVADLALDGHLAYLVGWAGLSAVDVSNLGAPHLLGQMEPPWDAFMSIVAAGGQALVGDWTPSLAVAPSALRVIDVSDPTAPREAGHLDQQGNAEDLDRVGNWAYVTDRYLGLRIVDVATPSHPAQTGLWRLRQGVVLAAAAVSNDDRASYIYVAAGRQGMEAIDVRDPAAPKQLAGVSGGSIAAVAISGSYAYLADTITGLRAIDISDPAASVEVGRLDVAGGVAQVSTSGSLVFVGTDNYTQADILVIDASDPTRLVAVDSFPIIGRLSAIVVAQDKVWVAAGESGVWAFRVEELDQPTPTASIVVPTGTTTPPTSPISPPTVTPTSRPRWTIWLPYVASEVPPPESQFRHKVAA